MTVAVPSFGGLTVEQPMAIPSAVFGRTCSKSRSGTAEG
jgi:hypothetical protein